MTKWLIGKVDGYSVPDHGENLITLPDGATPIGYEANGRYTINGKSGSMAKIVYIKKVEEK